jgi:hypothetical protein
MLWEWEQDVADPGRLAQHDGHGGADSGGRRGLSSLPSSAVAGGPAVASGGVVAGGGPSAASYFARNNPRELLHDEHPYHMVDFHPSGKMLMTGVKNKYGTHPDAVPGSEEQFTLKIVVHNFNRRVGVDFDRPVLEVPRVVAYNDAGIHFSPCGTMLAACIPGKSIEIYFRIAVLTLVPRGPNVPIGSILYETKLDPGRTIALTNLKFSPSSRHLLAGYSFRRSNPVLRVHAENYSASVGHSHGQGMSSQTDAQAPSPPQINVVDIYELTASPKLEIRRSLTADVEMSHVNHGGAEDEINVAVFAPSDNGGASGVVYGTQKGRVRLFQQHVTYSVASECPEEEGVDMSISEVISDDFDEDGSLKSGADMSSSLAMSRDAQQHCDMY